ncbi:MAG: DNA polymerase III subunit delta [Gemmatimonadota bacterium]
MSGRAEVGLDRTIERGELGGAFFLYGDASRLRDDAARRLLDAAIDPATRDFNLDTFRGRETDPEALAASLAMPPVMAARRVVVVYDAQDLAPGARKVIEEALGTLPEDVTLIVTARVPDGSRARFYRVLKEGSRCFEWAAPREAELPGWILDRARERHGLEIDPESAQALAAAVGRDLGILDAELEKLASAADGRVTVDDVRALVPNVRRIDRWAWLDRVAARDYVGAWNELPALLNEPDESATALLSMMAEQHLMVGIALESGPKGVSEALGEAGRPYLRWKSRVYAAQSKAWTADGIREAVRLIGAADARAKSGGAPRGVLEELLLRLRALGGEAA